MRISTLPDAWILDSSRPTWWPLDSWIDLAASPIIVLSPVSVTSISASPVLMMEPLQSFSPEPGSSPSSRGTATGSDSPVSAAWSTESSSPCSQRPSAGTTLPPRTKTYSEARRLGKGLENSGLQRQERQTTSAGTTSVISIMILLPSRLTGSLRIRPSLRASTELWAFSSR